MRDDTHPVSQALDAPARPIRSLLPLAPLLIFALRTGQLEPDAYPARLNGSSGFAAHPFHQTVQGYELHQWVELDSIDFQRVHARFPELARAVLEPCLDPGCDGPPGWGLRRDDDGRERPRRTLWELIRHLRRDHQWPLDRLAERLGGGRRALTATADGHREAHREALRRA